MKSKEEVEEIINNPNNDLKLRLFNILQSYHFSYDELTSMFVGTFIELFPNMNEEAFDKYCVFMRKKIDLIAEELKQLN